MHMTFQHLPVCVCLLNSVLFCCSERTFSFYILLLNDFLLVFRPLCFGGFMSTLSCLYLESDPYASANKSSCRQVHEAPIIGGFALLYLKEWHHN